MEKKGEEELKKKKILWYQLRENVYMEFYEQYHFSLLLSWLLILMFQQTALIISLLLSQANAALKRTLDAVKSSGTRRGDEIRVPSNEKMNCQHFHYWEIKAAFV